MTVEDNLPELPKENPGRTDVPETENGVSENRQIVRKRIRVRKKIRIKKKPSTKKKARKVAEKIFWFLIILGFVASLIILFKELDIRDEDYKPKKAPPKMKKY
jgi:hypothetical protein